MQCICQSHYHHYTNSVCSKNIYKPYALATSIVIIEVNKRLKAPSVPPSWSFDVVERQIPDQPNISASSHDIVSKHSSLAFLRLAVINFART